MRRAGILAIALFGYLLLAPLPSRADTPFTSVSVAAGTRGTCAIDSAGKAWCWGTNLNSQLGVDSNDGDLVATSPVPVDTTGVLSGKQLTQITAGSGFFCALDDGGNAYCWGGGDSGQLGGGYLTYAAAVPVAVVMPSGKTFTTIDAGYSHVCAVDQTGKGWCWGANTEGQLGDGFEYSGSTSPVDVTMPSGKSFATISAGGGTSCALDTTGDAWCWGTRALGRIGDGSNSNTAVHVPQAVTMPGTETFDQIAITLYATCAIDGNGNAWCWGANYQHVLGSDKVWSYVATVPEPVTMPEDASFATFSGGFMTHLCAVDQEGGGWCWGVGNYGELGNGTYGNATTPAQVTMPVGFTFSQISSGDYMTCARAVSGETWCWGDGEWGALGNGDSENRTSPTRVGPSGGGGGGGGSCEAATPTSDCHVISYSILSFRAISLSDTSPVAFGNVRQGHSATLPGPDLLYGTTWSGDQIYATISPESLDGISLLLDVTDVSPPDSGGCATDLGSEGTAAPLVTYELSSTESYLITGITDCGAGSGSAETDAHASIALTVDATAANLNADYSVPVTTTVTYTIDAGV